MKARIFFVVVLLLSPLTTFAQQRPPEIEWEKTFGGAENDWAHSIIQTHDGGYAVCGYTESKGAGGRDFWVIKLNDDGNINWEKTFGGPKYDEANSIIETSGGGYVVCGYTGSKGAGVQDFWLINITSIGEIIWENTFGGKGTDMAYSIIQTSDGGYAVCGETFSKGAANSDSWVIKLSKQGILEWEKIFGGSKPETAYSIIETSDGGYAVCGLNASNLRKGHFWVIKLNSQGTLEWEKIFGGSKPETAYSIFQTSDGGYVVCGYTESKGAGNVDTWVIKLNGQGTIEWEKTFGGSGVDYSSSIIQTNDGGYAVCGSTGSKGKGRTDIWVIKLNNQGTIAWEKTFGGAENDWARSIIQTTDGGYAVCGVTNFKGSGEGDFWVIKLRETDDSLTSKYSEHQEITVNVDMNIPQTKMVNNNAIAVVIGNRDYQKTKQVTFAINDARAIGNYLIKTLGFKDGNIFFVENATQGDFRTYFGIAGNHKGKLYNAVKKNKSDVFIFYSGHGAPGLNNQKGYFVPVESDPQYVELGGYPLETFYENISKIPTKSTTVVLDACFSGATIYENISPIVIKIENPVMTLSNGVVLSSSSGNQVSCWYNEKKHGLFTYFFLKAIHNRNADFNKDDQLTFAEIYQYISDESEGVPYYARRIHGVEQNPMIQGRNKDGVFVRY